MSLLLPIMAVMSEALVVISHPAISRRYSRRSAATWALLRVRSVLSTRLSMMVADSAWV